MSRVKKMGLAEVPRAGILQRFVEGSFRCPPQSHSGNRQATDPAAPFR
jgi:hypothetical protein